MQPYLIDFCPWSFPFVWLHSSFSAPTRIGFAREYRCEQPSFEQMPLATSIFCMLSHTSVLEASGEMSAVKIVIQLSETFIS